MKKLFTFLFFFCILQFATAQPTNDLCADAIPLTVDPTETCVPTAVDNNAATDSGEAAPSCASYSGGDAWYSVTVPASGNVTVETNNDGSGTVTDSGMSLYSGSCGALTEIECDDDDSADGLFSLVELTGQTPGDVIYVRVWEFGNDVAGTFSVCAYEPLPPPPPPANDECVDAIPLTAEMGMCTGTTPGTTTSSTESLPGCIGTANDDVWFSFVATDTNQDIDITGTGGTTTDIVTEVFDACAGTSIACQDTPNSPINLTGLTVGTTYYFRVYTWSAVADTDTEFTVCVGTPPPPPPGDECADPIPYPGDVETGTCVTGFDFTVFGDSGNPSPTCDFGGDAVAWFSWTAPIITAAGDPIDIEFDDGDGQAADCDIGIEAYEVDCTTPASNCLGNVSGTLTGLTQGTDYILLIYDDSAPADNCDFCLSIACSAPAVAATVSCQPGDEGNFYVEVDVTNFGVGNTAYTVDVGGPQANITAIGMTTYGPFPSGTPVDVVLTGVDDAACGATITGLDKDCICDPLAVEAVADGTVCPGDPFTLDATLNDVISGGFVDYTVTPAAAGSCTAVPDNPADCVDLALGDDAGSGPIPLGFNFDFFGVTYSSVCVGSNGYVTFTCVDETDISEDPIPNAADPNAIVALFWDDLNPTDAISGIICTYPATIGGQTCFVADYQGIAHFGGGETVTGQIIICPDNTVTINCIDCQSDGGTDTAGQGIEDETGSTGAFDPAFPDGTVPGAATTSNCVTFTPNVDPDSACDFVAWVTDVNDIAGTTVSTTNPFDVNPTMTTTYFAVVDCGGVPCFDDVVVTMDDPANCTACQGIDLAAGLPVIPTTVCSGATADICLTLIDATEGLMVTGTVDGAPVMLTGTAGAGANELCVTITAPVNETCAPVDVVIQIDAIQCTDGTDYPGILGGATLVDDLTTAGLNPLNVPVYPTLTVNTAGDGTCMMLTAELVAADGTVCATAAGSPLACSADGDALNYDFTADVAAFIEVPAACPLPTLTGTLTCGGCTLPCDGLASPPALVSPVALCDGDGPIDVCFDMVDATQGLNFDLNLDGAPAGIIVATPGANPNELCIQLPMVANQGCDLQTFNITFNAITCDNGEPIAGPSGGNLSDDLNAGGGIDITVAPTLTVNTSGDGTCMMLTAELVAADGTVCATAAGSPLACSADGDALNYDFSGDVTFTPPAACPLPTLTGTLTCGGCTLPCDGLASPPALVSPVALCDGDGPIDVCFDMVDATQGLNFDLNLDGAPVGIIVATPGANPNELCIQLPMVANQGCDLATFNITFNAITCDNGAPIAGPSGGNLSDDLNAGGGIDITVAPTLMVNTSGDGTCMMLTAELVAADGTVCATAAGSPLACSADGDVLNYDFSGDVTFTPPAACPLPTLTGTLTCSGCVCEEEITYDVIATGCDMTGAMIELLDGAGASLGTMALGMDGGFGSFGAQPCGDYMLIIMGAPACYLDEGGEVGPIAFTTDGSGTTNQTFTTTVANIPTVGEWGLIILGLLMSITAVVGIRQRKEEEIYG